MVVFIVFSAQSVTQFLEWHEKRIYFNQYICQWKIDGKAMFL